MQPGCLEGTLPHAVSKEPSPNPDPSGGAFSSLPIQASERRLLVCMAGTHPQPALQQCWGHEGALGPVLPVPQLDVVGFGDGDSAGWRGHGPPSCAQMKAYSHPRGQERAAESVRTTPERWPRGSRIRRAGWAGVTQHPRLLPRLPAPALPPPGRTFTGPVLSLPRRFILVQGRR